MFDELISPLIKIILLYLKKIHFKIYRDVLRGYNKLLRASDLGLIPRLKEKIGKKVISSVCTKDKWMLGEASDLWGISVAQFVYSKLLNVYFTRLLLKSFKRSLFIYPIPASLCVEFTNEGVRVSSLLNHTLWVLSTVLMYIYGIIKYISISCGILAKKLNGTVLNTKIPQVYFHSINTACLPSRDGVRLKTVVDWYVERYSKNNMVAIFSEMDEEDYNVNDFIQVRFAPILSLLDYSWFGYLKFNLFALFCTLYIPIRCAISREFYYMFMFGELIEAFAHRFSEKNTVLHLFNISKHVYKPLWAYEAEEKGNSVKFYFYSTNTQAFSYANSNAEGISHGYSLCTWKDVLVWDAEQRDYVNNTFIIRPINNEIVGSIPLSDTPDFIRTKFYTRPFAAVFDVQPHRNSTFCSLGQHSRYYDGAVAIQFNIDINEVVRELGFGIVRKRKREIGNNALKAYNRICNGLTDTENLEISPTINALHLIDKCNFVIAMPFTGVVLQAKELGKPVVYYDPFGGIVNPELYSHGIDCVAGKKELKFWIESNVKVV